jgi:signal peptidase II
LFTDRGSAFVEPRTGSDLRTLAVALAGFAADQVTKVWAASAVVGLDQGLDLMPGYLAVAPAENAGAVASLAAGFPLTGPICALVCLGLVFLRARGSRPSGAAGDIGTGLLTAGMLGNSADRLALGHVRDFLVSTWFPFCAINLADVLIVAGALTWLCASLGKRD